MNEFKLLLFYKIAVEGSFSKAAEELFISQPAVTKQIKSLEAELDIKLFERSSSGVVLTNGGKILFEHASGILSEYKKLRNDISLLSEQLTGELVIGASTTVAQYVLPPLLARFQRANPSLKIVLLNENTHTIEKFLHSGKINLGIIEGLPHEKSLKYFHFMEDELLFITYKTSKYAAIEKITINELKEINLVLRENGSGTLEVFEDYLHKNGCSLSEMKILIQLGSTESIKAFLRYSDSVGVISIQALSESTRNKEYKVMSPAEGPLSRNFYFVHTKGTPDSLVKKFISFLKNNHN